MSNIPERLRTGTSWLNVVRLYTGNPNDDCRRNRVIGMNARVCTHATTQVGSILLVLALAWNGHVIFCLLAGDYYS